MRIGRDGLGFGSQRLPTKIQQPSQCCWHQMAHQAEKIGSEKARGGNIALTIQLVLCGKQFLNYCLTDKQAHFLKTNSFLNITWILAYFYGIFSGFSQLCCWTDKQANFLRDTYSHRTSRIFDFWIFQLFFGRLDKLRIPICSGTRAHLLSPEMGPSSSCCALSLSVSFDGS